ncbi:transglycosylase domain-containing protein [Humibacillus xanthopallidus]|uniref:Membrane peptidoglycan carboxypeptidase n=1 Tax=Humibacillus xanthopallidus TaxID=412689 RepID=A0A543HA07_9MICO|nr:transglycosylase domain-containing protein [Humibacillus xanthopallidus]TQM55164.1 membrane peptidoglycan carboxypeptidase [Humibacillus xanthopallidus]
MSQSRHEIRAAQLAGSKGRTSGGGTGGPDGRGGTGFADGSGRGGGNGSGGRTGWKKWVLGTLKWGAIAGLALFVIGIVAVVVAYTKTSIPQPNELADKQVSIVYYADGKTELDRIAVQDGNRESVALSKVPKFVQDAHIAAEDRTFYQNNGISVGGILRAVKTSVTGETQVGGSTITQQYVKNYFLTQDRTLTRKAREILIAVKIDGQLSKSEILEKYLNTIYYGRGAYGIQSASKAYFGKDVSKLTVAEGAVLASVINAPSLYDPANGDKARANLEKRYAYVLDGMVEEGWLSAADRAKYTELPKILDYKGNRFSAGPNGFITAQVKKELLSTGLTEQDIDKGGLRIVTTIDKKAQNAAIAAMKNNLPKKVQGGLVAIRPGDGAVVAMYGGADYSKNQFNSATTAIMQGASNFKPFAVLAAVREGISTKTKFDGDQPQEIDGTKITNFGGRSYGMVDMRRMIGRSINTAFVNLNKEVTPAKTRQAAVDAGIPAKTPGMDDTLTNVLGTASPHVIDMASAYSTIASQGVRSKPYFVSKVTSTEGDFTYEAKPQTQRAFDKDVTADVTDAMTYTVKTGGTATKLQQLGRPIAGKTGTSSEAKSIWFSGFVPQLAVSIGMYKPDDKGNPQTLTDNEDTNLTGGTIPADVFYDFMKVALADVEVQDFPKRAGVGDDKIPTPTATVTQTPTQTQTPTATVTVPPSTTTQAPPSTTTQAPTKTNGTGKPTPTDTSTATATVALPLPTTTKPGKGP